MMAALHFAGTDCAFYAEDLDAQLLSDLMDCGGPGQADGAVAYVMENHTVTGEPADCAAYLKGYGAWDDAELADHDENLRRLVWMTGCALRETQDGGEMPAAYFSTY